MSRIIACCLLLLGSVSPGAPVITEFMASNQSGLQDSDGDFSDWVEIHNPDAVPIDLDGWYLTDNAGVPTKWRFPPTVIPAGGYKVVFASDKNRAVSGAPLHTNFALSSGGEYLGLVGPDGVTVASEFAPKFPAQSGNVSYGVPSNVVTSTLVAGNSAARWMVPTSASTPASTWKQVAFNDSSWNSATMGVGYDRNTATIDYTTEIGSGGNTDSAMFNLNQSCYLRIPFQVADAGAVLSLKLRLKYDDGFAAYLNGVPLTASGTALTRNAPTTLAWNSGATGTHDDAAAMVFEEFDVSSSSSQLVTGNNVLSFHVLNRNAGSSDLLLKAELLADVVSTSLPAGPGYFSVATPGARNGGAGTLVIPQTVTFSVPGGTFLTNFNLSMSGANSGQVIRYTTNGTAPISSSTPYTGSIAVTSSTQIRARVFDVATGASGVVTGASFEKLGSTLSSYGTTGQTFKSALPVLVLNNYGIGEIPNDNIYRDVRIQLFDRDAGGYAGIGGVPVFGSLAGAKIRGSSSAGFNKKSYSLELRQEAGDSRSEPLLGMPADSDWALVSCDDFDPSFMRNAWIYEAYRRIGRWAPRTRFVEVFFNQDGNVLDYSDYRGVYLLCETIRDGPNRVNVTRLESADLVQPAVSGGYVLKVDRYDTDEFQWHTNRALPPSTSGNAVVIHRPKLEDLATAQSSYLVNYFQAFEDVLFSEAAVTFATREYRNYIDSDSWVDHGLFNVFPKNVDALRLSSYYYKDRGRKIEGGPLWDFDRSANSTDNRDDAYNTWIGTGDATDYFTFAWWQPLFQDMEFRQLFVDRWQSHRKGALSNTSIQAIIDGFVAEFRTSDIDHPAARDYAKWYAGQGKSFLTETAALKSWLTNRAAWMDSQFTTPPNVFTAPGPLAAGQTVTLGIPAGTTVYYRLDGLDPRLEGGGVRAGTSVYTGVPIALGASTMIFARAWRSGSFTTPSTNWSGPVKPLYLIDAAYASSANLKLTALHFNPLGVTVAESAAIPDVSASDFEWIELGNSGAGAVNLEGVSLAADQPVSALTLPAFSLQPGERVVVVKRREAFLLRYPGAGSRIVGEWTGDRSLGNDGDSVRVLDRNGADIARFDFHDGGSWPARADGSGAAMQYLGLGTATADYENPDNWRSSAEIGGTPGSAGTGPRQRVLINEVLSASVLPEVDAIELLNPGDSALDLSGWFLSNSGRISTADDYRKFRIPNGTVIPPGGRVVFTERDFNPNGAWNPIAGNAAEWEFALDGPRGGTLWLVSADPVSARLDAFENRAELTPTLPGVSLGRVMDLGTELRPLARATLFDGASPLSPRPALGAPNSEARHGEIQISEIMYHPASGRREYVELVNTASVGVSLAGWTLRGDLDVDFSTGLVLAPGECMLLVDFDPLAAPLSADQFRGIYQVPPGVRLSGPWALGNSLGDSSGDLRLRCKVPPPADEPSYVGRMMEDEVSYAAFAPWPTGASGSGSAIHRLGVRSDGLDPLSWIAQAPSGGTEAVGVEAWNRLWFPGGGGSSAALADPDRDGLPNRLEYLLGRNPTEPEMDSWSAISKSPGDGVLLFEYRLRRDRGDFPLVPRQTHDLEEWTAPPQDEHVGFDGWFEIRRVRVPAGEARVFLRLESPVQ